MFSSEEKLKKKKTSSTVMGAGLGGEGDPCRRGSSKLVNDIQLVCFVWETRLTLWPDVNVAWCIIQRILLGQNCRSTALTSPSRPRGGAHLARGACTPRQRWLHHLQNPVNTAHKCTYLCIINARIHMCCSYTHCVIGTIALWCMAAH